MLSTDDLDRFDTARLAARVQFQEIAHRRMTVWTIARTTGDGVSTPRATMWAGSVTAFIARNRDDAPASAEAQVTIYTAPWLAFAALGTDIQVGDVLFSGASAFLVAGAVEVDEWFTRAPLSPCVAPGLATAARHRIGQGLQAGLRAGM
jgi:hypothetical protein